MPASRCTKQRRALQQCLGDTLGGTQLLSELDVLVQALGVAQCRGVDGRDGRAIDDLADGHWFESVLLERH